MPIHNWSRVSDGMFHWFHQRWIGTIADWLNQGRFPEGFYAIGEVYANEVEPDVLAVEDRPPEDGRADGHLSNGFGVALLESPPKTRFTWEAETESYLAKKDLIAVRSVITLAFLRQAKLLIPRKIRAYREKLGLTQKQLAGALGVAEATVSRWETGAQIQQRSLDNLLRVFFGLPDVREALINQKVSALGLVSI